MAGDDEVKHEGYCLMHIIEEYDKMFSLQKRLNQARFDGKISDTVIFLEHHPCYTIGRQGGEDHILVSDNCLEREGIRVYETDRGGDITYHGPGQLVCYPIIDLHEYSSDVHVYAHKLEEVMILTLEKFDINGARKKGFPGVWVGEKKIGFMGVGINHWVTMHGISLNVCPDMKYFTQIIPCGIANVTVVSMAEILGHPITVNEVAEEMRQHFEEVFDIQLQDMNLDKVEEMVRNV